MPFSIQTQKLSSSTTPANFDFSHLDAGNIQAVVYGISQLRLAIAQDLGGPYPYGGAQTALENVVVSLTPQSGTGVGFPNLELIPTITLTGDTGGNSNVTVTVLAYLGDSPPSWLKLANPSVGGQGISTSVPSVLTGFLSGFSMTSDDSASTLGMGAAAGMSLSPYAVPSKPSAVAVGNALNLVTNNKPMTTAVDVGAIVLSQAQSELLVGTSQVNQQAQPGRVTATDVGLMAGGIFLQSFFLGFRISSSVSPTPDFTAMTVGAPGLTAGSSGGSFEPVMSLFSSYGGHSASGGSVGAGADAASYSSTYVWVGIPSS